MKLGSVIQRLISRMKIEVTQEDIKAGQKDCVNNPFALAATRKMKRDCLVAYSSVYVIDEPIPLPPAAQKWLEDYHAGKPVHPLEFCLELR